MTMFEKLTPPRPTIEAVLWERDGSNHIEVGDFLRAWIARGPDCTYMIGAEDSLRGDQIVAENGMVLVRSIGPLFYDTPKYETFTSWESVYATYGVPFGETEKAESGMKSCSFETDCYPLDDAPLSGYPEVSGRLTRSLLALFDEFGERGVTKVVQSMIGQDRAEGPADDSPEPGRPEPETVDPMVEFTESIRRVARLIERATGRQ